MGTSRAWSNRLMWDAVSKPSIPGMSTSSSTTAKSWRSISFMAVLPRPGLEQLLLKRA